jgi:hypothetical protein
MESARSCWLAPGLFDFSRISSARTVREASADPSGARCRTTWGERSRTRPSSASCDARAKLPRSRARNPFPRIELARNAASKLRVSAISFIRQHLWHSGSSNPARERFAVAERRRGFARGLTFDMSGPEPDWPAKWNMNQRNVAGQAGGGPLDGRVRPHPGFTLNCPESELPFHWKPQRFARLGEWVHSASLPDCSNGERVLKTLISFEDNQR